jgi:hypothetical protein
MAVITVVNVDNSGAGSLREAIQVQFDPVTVPS